MMLWYRSLTQILLIPLEMQLDPKRLSMPLFMGHGRDDGACLQAGRGYAGTVRTAHLSLSASEDASINVLSATELKHSVHGAS